MPFYDLKSTEYKRKRPGVFVKLITGKKMEMTLQRLKHGVKTNHTHINEQIGYVLSGEVEITIGTETKVCRQGDGYLIPSNTQHGFNVISKDGAECIEICSPPKS